MTIVGKGSVYSMYVNDRKRTVGWRKRLAKKPKVANVVGWAFVLGGLLGSWERRRTFEQIGAWNRLACLRDVFIETDHDKDKDKDVDPIRNKRARKTQSINQKENEIHPTRSRAKPKQVIPPHLPPANKRQRNIA
jgi:hypothetical protein